MTGSRIFNWNPEDYASHSEAQKSWGDSFLRKLVFQTTDTILDLGCGDGILTSIIAEKVSAGKIIGSDISREMVCYARSHFPEIEQRNLSFFMADSLYLPFKQGFSVVFSNSSLHWISDHRSLLAEIYRVLYVQGRFFASMGGRGNMGVLIDATGKVISKSEWSRYFTDFPLPFTFFSPDEYYPLLTEAGFTVQRLELIPVDMVQNGKEGLLDAMRNVWQPFLERVPDFLEDLFLSEVIDYITEKHPPDTNGLIHLPMFRLEIEAYKE